jgi:hypothetical protein
MCVSIIRRNVYAIHPNRQIYSNCILNLWIPYDYAHRVYTLLCYNLTKLNIINIQHTMIGIRILLSKDKKNLHYRRISITRNRIVDTKPRILW